MSASNQNFVNAQADAEVASAVQPAGSCEQAVCAAGHTSTVVEPAQPVGASDDSSVDAQAEAEVASPVQPASTADSCAQAAAAIPIPTPASA